MIRRIEFCISVKGNDGRIITKHFCSNDSEWSELCALIGDFRKNIIDKFGIGDKQLCVRNDKDIGGSTQTRLSSLELIRKDELQQEFKDLRSLLIKSVKETNCMEERKTLFIREVEFTCSDISETCVDTEINTDGFEGFKILKEHGV